MMRRPICKHGYIGIAYFSKYNNKSYKNISFVLAKIVLLINILWYYIVFTNFLKQVRTKAEQDIKIALGLLLKMR